MKKCAFSRDSDSKLDKNAHKDLYAFFAFTTIEQEESMSPLY